MKFSMFQLKKKKHCKCHYRSVYHNNISSYDHTGCFQASELEVFDETHKWLIMSENYNKTIQLLDKISLRIDSNIIILLTSNVTEVRFAYDIYNPSKEYGGKNNSTFIGLWRYKTKSPTLSISQFYNVQLISNFL